MTGGPVTVVVNGRACDLNAATTLAEVVAAQTASPTGVAVAVNDEVVPRAAWPATQLRPGDRVEVLIAVQGG